MQKLSVFRVIGFCLLMGCGSALPEPQSLQTIKDHEVNPNAPRQSAGENQPQKTLDLPLQVCSQIRVGLVELPAQMLASQSLRVPDFSQFNRDSSGLGAPGLRTQDRIQFTRPILVRSQGGENREFYFVWTSECPDQRIVASEFQYARMSLENRVYQGRSQRLARYHAVQHLWYLPLSAVLAPSDQEAWASRSSDTDLHRLKLRVQVSSGVWREFEIFFNLQFGAVR